MIPRKASLADAAALATLHRQVFPDGPWDEGFWSGTIANAFDTVLLSSEPATGFAAYRLLGDEAEILTIGTTRPRRGEGAALLEAMIVGATAAGAERLFLEVSTSNKAALALYRRFGFQEAGTRRAYYRDGSDAAILRLSLARGDD